MGDTEYTNQEYIAFDPFGGDRDIEVKCKTVKIVKTRKPHTCFFQDEHKIKVGEMARFEKALVDGQWGSYYTCLNCLKKRMNEIGF